MNARSCEVKANVLPAQNVGQEILKFQFGDTSTVGLNDG